MKAKITTYELYFDTEEELDNFRETFDLNNSYCIKYNGKKIHFAKVGFLDYLKKDIKEILSKFKELHNIKKTVECIPPLWHHDVELAKFMSYDMYRTMKFYASKYKQTYHKIESRKFSDINYPVDKEDITTFTALDFAHMFHHLFNHFDRDYEQELYIYDRCKGLIDFTARHSYKK